jgi:hypothetical protein
MKVKKWAKVLAKLFIVTMMLQNTYFGVDGKLYCDFVLNGEQYEGVYQEDMHNMFNNAMEQDMINNGIVQYK